MDLARIGWLVTVLICLIAVLILVLQGYLGYAGVTFAVAVAAALSRLSLEPPQADNSAATAIRQAIRIDMRKSGAPATIAGAPGRFQITAWCWPA